MEILTKTFTLMTIHSVREFSMTGKTRWDKTKPRGAGRGVSVLSRLANYLRNSLPRVTAA